MLKGGDREPERHLELPETSGRGRESRDVAGELGAKAARVRVEQRRPLARAQRLDPFEQLLEPDGVAYLERGLQRLDERELDGEVRHAEVSAREHGPNHVERLARLALRAQHVRLVR